MGKNKRFVGVPTQERIKPEETNEQMVNDPILDNTLSILSVKTAEVDAYVDGVQSHLNIRSTPEVKADNVVSIVKNGTSLKVIEPETTFDGSGEKWYKVRIENENPVDGYAMTKYIKTIFTYKTTV